MTLEEARLGARSRTHFRSPLHLTPVALAAVLAVSSLSAAHAQELLAQAGGTPQLKEVVISSTRSSKTRRPAHAH